MVRIVIENLGPFRRGSVELRPLTIVVGKNSVGKSMLLYLLWSTMSLAPDFSTLGDLAASMGAMDLANAVMKLVTEGKNPSREFRELLKIYVRVLPKALARSFEERLVKVFGVQLPKLLYKGSDRGRIVVEGASASIEFTISSSGIDARFLSVDESLVDKYEAVVPVPGKLVVMLNGVVVGEGYVASLGDVISVLMTVLGNLIVHALSPFFLTEYLCALLVDSRAGLARTLLKPFVDPSIAKGLLYADEQFIRLYYRLTEALARGNVVLDLAEPLVRELGVELVPVLEHGMYRLRVRTWTGYELPFEFAPSGVREAVITALALCARDSPRVVLIEEPEAHLHPRAQKAMARLVARSVNVLGKLVVISTHSDYIVYTLSNLIALSRASERAREVGYSENEVLKPENVAAYLVKQNGDAAELVELEVGEEGIDESSFAEIVHELADERVFASL